MQHKKKGKKILQKIIHEFIYFPNITSLDPFSYTRNSSIGTRICDTADFMKE